MPPKGSLTRRPTCGWILVTMPKVALPFSSLLTPGKQKESNNCCRVFLIKNLRSGKQWKTVSYLWVTAPSVEVWSSLLPLWHGLLGPACTVSLGGRHPETRQNLNNHSGFIQPFLIFSYAIITIDSLDRFQHLDVKSDPTCALPLRVHSFKLTFGSVIMASSSTLPVTQGSVVTSKDFLSGLNWKQKHEHTENLGCSCFWFVNLWSKCTFLWKEIKQATASYSDSLNSPLIQSKSFLPRPYSCLVFLLV